MRTQIDTSNFGFFGVCVCVCVGTFFWNHEPSGAKNNESQIASRGTQESVSRCPIAGAQKKTIATRTTLLDVTVHVSKNIFILHPQRYFPKRGEGNEDTLFHIRTLGS